MNKPTIQPLSMRIGDLELRTCDENLLQRRQLSTLEIIRWEKKDDGSSYNYVAAMWRMDKDGYFSLEFIGDRPFSTDPKVFWKLAQFGQEYLGEQMAIR